MQRTDKITRKTNDNNTGGISVASRPRGFSEMQKQARSYCERSFGMNEKDVKDLFAALSADIKGIDKRLNKLETLLEFASYLRWIGLTIIVILYHTWDKIIVLLKRVLI